MADDVGYLKSKAQEWAGLVVNLYNTPVPAHLQAEKNALINTAKKIKDTIETVTGPLSIMEPLNHLGVIPVVIGIVGVGTAVTLITKWVIDYQTFTKKVAEYRALQDGGLSPQQAANVVAKLDDKTLFGLNTNKIIWSVGGLGALYFFAKKQRWI